MSELGADLASVLVLMRSALGRPLSERDALVLQRADAKALLGISSAHAVMPLLGAASERPEVAHHLDPDLCLFLKEMRARNAARNTALRGQLTAIGRAMAAAGTEAVALKGGADLLTPIHAEGCRFSIDLDILVPADKLEAARRLMLNLGFVFTDDEGRYTDEKHIPSLVSQAHAAPVELHRRIVNGRWDQVLPASLVLETAQSSDIEGMRVPPPWLRLLHVIAHANERGLPGRPEAPRLRDLAEIDLIWARLTTAERTAARARCEAHGLAIDFDGLIALTGRLVAGSGKAGAELPGPVAAWVTEAIDLLAHPELRRRSYASSWLANYGRRLARPATLLALVAKLRHPRHVAGIIRFHISNWRNMR